MDAFPRAATAPRRAAGTATGAANAPAPPTHSVRRPRGVRRRRDDNAASLEIEELDSDVMRQNSYNYFQHHSGSDAMAAAVAVPVASAGNPNEAASAATGVPPTTTSGGGRKRQRTLAEQLEDLSLHANGTPRTGSAMSGAAAAAACRQAWNRIFASQMAAAQQRAVAEKAAKAAKAAAAAAPAASSRADVDMDGPSVASSAAEDGDLEDADVDDDDRGRDSGSFKVVGGVPDVKGMFFSQGAGRQRPMERMFRHYVTMAAERSSRPENGTPRGDELVLFQQGPTSLEFPYSLFTPEQVEDLRARHNRKKKRQPSGSDRGFARSMFASAAGGGGGGGTGSSGFSSDQSWRFQELDSSDEADVSSSAEDSDMDMSGDGEAKPPQLAGALSHGEWFVEDEDDEDDDSEL